MGNRLDLFGLNVLLNLYAKSGVLSDAQKLFDEMPERNTVSFGLVCYADSGLYGGGAMDGVDVFRRLCREGHEMNVLVFTTVLKLLASMDWAECGSCLHGCVLKLGHDGDAFVGTALIDAYSRCGMVDAARGVFDGILLKDMVSWTECEVIENSMELFLEAPNRNDVAWNTLIVGYGQLGDGELALTMFMDMLDQQMLPSEVTYSSVLRACASLAAMDPGAQIHSLTVKTKLVRDNVVANSLIDMYACSNMGLLDDGEAFFTSMVRDFQIEPCVEHYTCMVWLLGRSGKLKKAMNLIGEMPFEPSVMVWRALLGACVIHHDLDQGRVAAERVLQMEPEDEASHVLLSNIYATAKRRNQA
ncbi:Pentatricopeptide repeat-containing protein [Drosera capensis]